MKLESLRIENFGICKYLNIELSYLTAIVGENNSGKSTILKAIDFLINPSTAKITQESFWSLDRSLEIGLEGKFVDLNDVEKEKLKSYLFTFTVFFLFLFFDVIHMIHAQLILFQGCNSRLGFLSYPAI